jgi:hypothetical protein
MPPDDVAAPAPAGAPETAGAPAGESTDDIVNDLLGGDGDPPEPGDAPAGDDPPEPAADEDAEADPEDDDAAEPDDDDDAAEPDAPDGAALKAARAALKAGDLDKAFKLAFGLKPEQVQPNAKIWTQWRAANDRQRRAMEGKSQAVTQQTVANEQWYAQAQRQISSTIEQLRPYEEIQQARLAFKRDGDPSMLVKMIEGVTELPYDDAQKVILQKQRRTPGERLMAQQLAEIRAKLEEATATKAQEQQKLSTEQVYANDLQHIRGAVKGEVTKVPRFAERIYRVLIKTKTPVGLSMTPEEAGRRVLAAERRRLAKHPLLAKEGKRVPPEVSAAAAKLAARNKRRLGTAPAPLLRRDSQNNGAANRDEESTDDIVNDILKNKKRAAV